jgi:hypothetical protein
MIDYSKKPAGEFQNSETGVWFTYEVREFDSNTVKYGFTHVIHMSNGTTRDVRLLQTVVYVAVDEDAFGDPVMEKWQIKNHHKFSS